MVYWRHRIWAVLGISWPRSEVGAMRAWLRVGLVGFAALLGAVGAGGQAAHRAQLVAQLGHSSDVKAAALSADGKLVLTGGADGSARLWEVASGRELRRFF